MPGPNPPMRIQLFAHSSRVLLDLSCACARVSWFRLPALCILTCSVYCALNLRTCLDQTLSIPRAHYAQAARPSHPDAHQQQCQEKSPVVHSTCRRQGQGPGTLFLASGLHEANCSRSLICTSCSLKRECLRDRLYFGVTRRTSDSRRAHTSPRSPGMPC